MPRRVDPGRVVVFGDVIDDVVAVPSGPIRPDTDTPTSIRYRAGGSAANTAAWLGSLGATVDFVGRVGAADVSRHGMSLQAAGVRPLLSMDAQLPTGTIVILVEGERRTMLTERGANAALNPDDVTDELLQGAAALHFTGYSLFGNQRADAVRSLIARARGAGLDVSVDPGSAGFIEDFGVADFLDTIDGATMVFPNLDEGKVLTGLSEPEDIVQALARRFEVVALTLGTDGVWVGRSDGSKPGHVGAVTVRVADPTGAGDAFSAGFLYSWLQSRNATTAAKAGVRVAARSVTVIGGRPPV